MNTLNNTNTTKIIEPITFNTFHGIEYSFSNRSRHSTFYFAIFFFSFAYAEAAEKQ